MGICANVARGPLLRAVPGFFQSGRSSSANATHRTQLSAWLQDIAKNVKPAVIQIFNSSYAVTNAYGLEVYLRDHGAGIWWLRNRG
jgi:hypothetical protein